MSERGRLRQGAGGHPGGDPRLSVLMLLAHDLPLGTFCRVFLRRRGTNTYCTYLSHCCKSAYVLLLSVLRKIDKGESDKEVDGRCRSRLIVLLSQ